MKILTVIKLNTMLFCGLVDPQDPTTIHKPKLIYMPSENVLALQDCIGKPKSITLKDFDYGYPNQDPKLKEHYYEAIGMPEEPEEPEDSLTC